MSMKAILGAMLLVGMASTSQAGILGAPLSNADSAVTNVGIICGPGAHLGPGGRCRSNAVVVVPRRTVVVVRRRCGVGAHLGPLGVCL